LARKEVFTPESLDEALYHGAVLRVRPKAMTVAVIIAGLLPILWGTGAGSEVMSRIAAPMIGGMITAPLLSLFIIPAAYKLIWLRRHKKACHKTVRTPGAGVLLHTFARISGFVAKYILMQYVHIVGKRSRSSFPWSWRSSI
jgi:Cu(I)/Ag(I) efflux system membrane protein CusA/SilA